MSSCMSAVRNLFALLAIGAVIGGASAKPPSRIQGGVVAGDGQFLGTITLSNPGNFVHACAGGVIGPRHILTAAHCVAKKSSSDISIRAGIHNIGDHENVIERFVAKVYVHSAYIPYIEGQQAVQNDIAVLVLTQDLPIGERISVYNLPTHQPEEGSYFVAGWGQNLKDPTTYQFELKALAMTLGDDKKCSGSVPKTICAYSESGSTCSGDSGSPLLRGGYIYGIDSAGGCTIGNPTTFTNVWVFRKWIDAIINNNPYDVIIR